MSIRPKERLPLFELSLVLVAAFIGWAEFKVVRSRSQAEDALKAADVEAGNGWQEAQKLWQKNHEQRQALADLSADLQDELNRSQEIMKQDELALPETRRLQDEYLALADIIQTNLMDMQAAMTGKALEKNAAELPGFKRRREELNQWITKQKERVALERFDSGSRELKARFEQERLTSNSGLAAIPMDLGSLLHQIGGSYSNYFAETENILVNNIKKSYYGPEFERRLKKTEEEAARLLELASQARTGAGAIKTFVDLRWQAEARQHGQQLHGAMQSFVKAQARLGTNEPALSRKETNLLVGAASEILPSSASLLSPLYPLILAQIGLGIFLMVAIYRRVVVERLRISLQETATENKLAHFEKLAIWQAHEIKQPLTAINAWLWTLEQSLPEGTPEQNVAVAIRHETDRLDQFVKEFLKLARALEPKLISVKAEPALREIQTLFQPQLERQKIKLNVELAANASFRADPQQLKQVLINLVQNAAESIEQDGLITLRTRQDRVPLKGRNSDVVIIEVEDNGPGIPAEVQPRLFDPFFSTKKEGTGLGLAIAARIVDRHGGVLEVRSPPGHGATFGLVLPVCHNGE
ncbi:MAG TPA: ATP-binding protein [Verrucomicrobiae bacterium]|nr:ATP-binding protein [Verrucomicrobiae bacterium]